MTYIDSQIDSEWHRVSATASGVAVNKLLEKYVNDVAKSVERAAKRFAPVGPTQELKTRGVVRTEATGESVLGDGGVAGSFVDPSAPTFGGGFAIRGGNLANRGQFSGVDKWNAPGHVFIGGITRTFYEATVKLNPLVPHSKWVHEGTGIYGPRGVRITPTTKPFLVFNIDGRKFVVKSVFGQRPQPFLTRAFEYANNVYSPARLSRLRLEIEAVT